MQTEKIHTLQAGVPPLVLDRRESAAALRVSIRKLDSLIQRGELTATRIDGRVVVAWTELLRFVKSRSIADATAEAESRSEILQLAGT